MTDFSLRAALLFSCALAATPALADDAAPEPAETGEIVVNGDVLYSDRINALRTPTQIIDVPQSLTIITQDEILDRGWDSIAQIIDYTPGVNTSQGEGHRDAVVFRGVRSTADFFIDGVRDDVQYYRSLYNLQKVEILRGPNALLFGRGGTGGILNRVTKKGVIGEVFASGLASIDTFGAYTIQADINAAVGDNVALRLNAAYEELNNHRDFFDGERIGINPTARIVLGEDTTLDLAYEYIDHERFVDRGIPSNDAGDPALQLIDITFGDPENNFTQLEAHVLRANIQHRFSDALKGNFNVSYGDYDKVYSNLFAVGFDEAANTVALDGYIDTTQRENFIVSGNLAGEFETGEILHTVLVGAEYIDTVNNNDRFNAFFDQTQDDVEFFTATRPLSISGGVGVNASGNQTINDFSDLNDDTEADVTVYSLFIQDEIELTSWLNVVLGARYDRFEITVDNIETFIDTGERDILSRTDEEISPRVGLILKPQENISIYGSYSESFLPRSGEQFADINPPNDALDPNTFENLEAGIKWDAADRVSFTAAIFEVRQSSPQVSDNDPGTLDVIDTQVQGFEFQVKGEVTPWWFVTAGYSYLDGEQANSDLRPRELPENMFSIWNQFQPTERLGIGLGLIAQDESFADNGNTVTLPSYERVDIAAFYDVTDTVRVQVNIENLFDQDYFPNAHTADNLTVGAPLNALFTLRARY